MTMKNPPSEHSLEAYLQSAIRFAVCARIGAPGGFRAVEILEDERVLPMKGMKNGLKAMKKSMKAKQTKATKKGMKAKTAMKKSMKAKKEISTEDMKKKGKAKKAIQK
jgi:hypothetical protein